MKNEESLTKLADEFVQQLGTKTKSGGVHVNGVFDGSRAAKAGIQTGDLLLAVNDVPLMSLQDYINAMQDPPAKQVFDVLRNNQLIQLTIERADE